MFKLHVKATIYKMKARIPGADASFFKCEGKIEFCSLRDKRLRGRRALGFMDLPPPRRPSRLLGGGGTPHCLH